MILFLLHVTNSRSPPRAVEMTTVTWRMKTLGRAARISAIGIRSRLQSLLRFMEWGSKTTSVVVTERCPPRATRPRAPVRMAGSEMNCSKAEAGRARWFAGTLSRTCVSGVISGVIIVAGPFRFRPPTGLSSAYCVTGSARWGEAPCNPRIHSSRAAMQTESASCTTRNWDSLSGEIMTRSTSTVTLDASPRRSRPSGVSCTGSARPEDA